MFHSKLCDENYTATTKRSKKSIVLLMSAVLIGTLYFASVRTDDNKLLHTPGNTSVQGVQPHQLTFERIAAYNKYYATHNGIEWSFDLLERQYNWNVSIAVYPRLKDKTPEKDVLFVDGREQCETARGFLIAVRQSGFKGKIVYMVYANEDESDCQPLAEDFQPMIIFYRSTPPFEPTMLQYYGIVNYAKAFHDELASIRKVAVVKPEAIFWCNRRNPFNDIPVAKSNSIYAVVGQPTDINSFRLSERKPTDSCFSLQGLRFRNGTVKKGNTLIDSFVAASNFQSLLQFASVLLEEYQKVDLDSPKASYDLVNNFQNRSDPVAKHLKNNLVEMTPLDRYTVADCSRYLPENSSCLNCDRSTVIVGTSSCVRRVTYDTPNYSPYCLQPHREAIMEVPSKTTMAAYAEKRILFGAHQIRDQPDGIFSEPSEATRSVTSMCPHGTMAVVSMMAGYSVGKVKNFIGSFLSHADPNCVKLVMIIKPGMDLENVSQYFHPRIEHVVLSQGAEHYPVKMKDCKPADSRFEVAQRWLEKNYQRFRYVVAPDSRDYLWQADPLAQLIKILTRQGYSKSEFVASVAEPYLVGAQTYPSPLVGRFLRSWIMSCGKKCSRKISKLQFTNGEPLAVLNSGHIIGTSVGLLHYFRFHVRMMNESGHKCDGTDQGLFTYYMYGMLQEAHYPHPVLVFSSSRSGFANMPPPSRMSKRLRADNPNPQEEIKVAQLPRRGLPLHVFEQEYVLTDCDNNIIAGLHQFDRHGGDYFLLERNPSVWKPWLPWYLNETLAQAFNRPKRK